ncbi:60s acidic ribosomal protein p1-alpha 5 [Moniliophthora roreri]|nr:60s acidic ribosomal protein p1-alpha 5 [Moniliophthora roreri]
MSSSTSGPGPVWLVWFRGQTTAPELVSSTDLRRHHILLGQPPIPPLNAPFKRSKLNKWYASTDLAPAYAALILADEGVEITSDKILALTTAAGVEVEPIWASLLAKALEGKDVKELLSNIGSGGGAPAAAVGGGAAAGGAAAAEAPKEEEKKEEEKEESDEDMGFGLFD